MKIWLLGIILLSITSRLYAQVDESEEKGVTYKLVPTMSSNPTSGTGFGAIGMGIYQMGDSSPSQALLAAQYTNTESYNAFLINKMFFDSDKWQSNSFAGKLFNNSQYPIPPEFLPILPPSINPDDGIKYNVTIYVAAQQFLYEAVDNYYVGGQLYYIDQKFNALNTAGEAFLKGKGIEDSVRGGYGATVVYDSRSENEKFFATDSSFVDLTVSQFPEFMGIKEQYYNMVLNARKYIHGFKDSDVFAMQLYGQYSSENTPDGALAGLGARNIIRGFPIGQYKTRYMLAAQGEYRYRIDKLPIRLAAFAGYANMSGGSKGDGEGNNRDGDNGNYYSGGIGAHYILDKKQQVDYRLNIAYTSDSETSVYVSLNQAF